MLPLLSTEQMRAFDQLATARGVPSPILMENAGRGACDVIERALAGRRQGGLSGARAVVVCGSGNNGGDGLVVARRLKVLRASPVVFLLAQPDRLTPDARVNYDAWSGLGGETRWIETEAALAELERELAVSELAIDALFGTGLTRELGALHAAVVRALSSARGLRVALDVPSGLDSQRGRVLGAGVEADVTVTFAHLKLGLMTSAGARHAGRVHVVDIGVPAELYREVGCSAELVRRADVASWLSPRRADAHKGIAGRVHVVGGSPGRVGAALLAARAALRTGAGLVTIATRREVADVLDARVMEEMTLRLDPADPTSVVAALSTADALALGPGLGVDDQARALIEAAVFGLERPLVVDADALTLLSSEPERLRESRARLVLTPHPGEMARLLGTSAREVEADRFAAVERCVSLTGAVVLLKGPHTIVGAPGQLPLVNDSGTPALATGGAGDVLSGVIAACLVELEPRLAAAAGAHLHGLAAEAWAAARGNGVLPDRGLLAHELAEALPGVLAGLAGPAAALTL